MMQQHLLADLPEIDDSVLEQIDSLPAVDEALSAYNRALRALRAMVRNNHVIDQALLELDSFVGDRVLVTLAAAYGAGQAAA